MTKTGLKVISVIMAVLLWFYVVNQGDLTPRQNIFDANLRYMNLEEGLSIILPDTISVKLWGVVQDSEEIIAYVDVKGLQKGNHKVPVQVEPVPGALFTSVVPDTVEVIIKGEKEKSLPITHIITRNPALGYELIDVVKTPDHCFIKGEESLVNQVNKVVCELDLDGITGIKSTNLPLKALDSSGQIITKGIRLVPDNINLHLVVEQNMVTKEIPINLVLTGMPAEGYHITHTRLIPEKGVVIMPSLVADNVGEIKTEPLDIAGRNEPFNQEIEVIVPEGLNFYPDKVIIDVGISPIIENEGEND